MSDFTLLYGLMLTLVVSTTIGIQDISGQQLPLQSYNEFESFPNHAVTAITQDEKGYLWIGTQAGLSRFDGHEFVTWSTTHGLAGNIVSEIAADGGGGFWLATNDGLTHFTPDTARAIIFDGEISANNLWDMHITEGDTIWLASNGGGLLRYTLDGAFKQLKVEGGQAENTFYWVTQVSDGSVLAGGRFGLFSVEGDTLVKRFSEELPVESLNVIMEDSKNRIWLGYQRAGMYRIDGNSVEHLGWLPLTSIRSMTEDGQGTIWAGGDGEGLAVIYNDHDYDLYTTAHGLSGNEIGSIFADKHGAIWIGQLYQGLEKITNRGIINYHFGRGDISFVNGIFKSSNGDLWASTFNGVHQICDETIRHHLQGYRTFHTTETPDGTMWHAAIENQLIGNRNGEYIIPEIDNETDDVFLAIAATSAGSLLAAGYWSGLFHMESEKFTRKDTLTADLPRGISQILEADGNLWLNSFFDGLILYEDGGMINKGLFEMSGSTQLNHIWYDGDKIWLASDRGVFQYYDGRFTNLQDKYGFDQKNYTFAVVDGSGRIWTGTDSGIMMYDGERKQYLTTANGLPGSGLNAGAVLLEKNTLWVGTVNGLMRINLDRVDFPEPVPHIEFTRLQLYDQDLPEMHQLRFRHNENYLKFDFTGLYLPDPQSVRYRYKMDRIDQGWQFSEIPSVQYTSIPPGSYRFELQAEVNGRGWTEQAAVIEFEILPPFWQTWWFILICLAGISLILYGIHSYRVAQILRIEKMRMQIAGDLHDEVGSNLSSISLLAEMVNRSGVISPDEKKRIERMRNASLQTLEAMSDIVWAINPDNDSLDDLIMKMKEVANVLLDGIEHKFDVDESIEKNRVDLLFKRDFFLVFKEALNNIRKHSGASRVEISIRKEESYLCMTITDNGCGFEMTGSYNGMGLKTMKKRAEKLNGSLQIESKKGKGTKTSLKAKFT